MSSVSKHAILFGSAAALSLALFAGCAGQRSQSQPAPAAEAPAEKPVVILPASSADTLGTNILVWDAVFREYHAPRGATNATFTFSLTNVSRANLVIYDTSTSCDCTAAKLPAAPWTLLPGGHGQIQATVDLRRKPGVVTNYVIVFTSKGNKLLLVKTVVPRKNNPALTPPAVTSSNHAAALPKRRDSFLRE